MIGNDNNIELKKRNLLRLLELNLKTFSCLKLWDYNTNLEEFRNIFEVYGIETLEELAVALYKCWVYKAAVVPLEQIVQILDDVLSERCDKLDKNHIWTDENVKGMIKISELFVSSFEKANDYAELIKEELALKKNCTEFLMDYEIEIKLTPYIKGYEDAEKKDDFCFMNVLCEPIDRMYDDILSGETTAYFDRSTNWIDMKFCDENNEIPECFKNVYISYAIHELLDTDIWSFWDIININRICAEVKVKHQSFIGEYYENTNK